MHLHLALPLPACLRLRPQLDAATAPSRERSLLARVEQALAEDRLDPISISCHHLHVRVEVSGAPDERPDLERRVRDCIATVRADAVSEVLVVSPDGERG